MSTARLLGLPVTLNSAHPQVYRFNSSAILRITPHNAPTPLCFVASHVPVIIAVIIIIIIFVKICIYFSYFLLIYIFKYFPLHSSFCRDNAYYCTLGKTLQFWQLHIAYLCAVVCSCCTVVMQLRAARYCPRQIYPLPSPLHFTYHLIFIFSHLALCSSFHTAEATYAPSSSCHSTGGSHLRPECIRSSTHDCTGKE